MRQKVSFLVTTFAKKLRGGCNRYDFNKRESMSDQDLVKQGKTQTVLKDNLPQV